MKNKKLSDFPAIEAEFHKTKNGTITPDMIIAGSHKKYWWQCEKGHEWQAVCDKRTGKNTGCPYCANKLACKDNCLSTFPKIAAEFHKTKNGTITPDMIIAGSHKKYWWQCEKGHEWQATCNKRTGLNRGCPYCANKLACKDNCLSTFLKIAAEFHKAKNGTITPDMVIAGSDKKYWWQCEKGHEWQATCVSRTGANSGCPYCANRLVCNDNCLPTLFPKIAAEFHKAKNGTITPDMVIAGSDKKYWWQCEKGHEWQAACRSRTKKNNSCPVCNIFKGEKRICDYLTKANVKFKFQHRIKRNSTIMVFDFVVRINGKLVIIEFQGEQHFGPICFGGITKQKALEKFKKDIQRDQNKRNYCKLKGHQLLEIPYWEFNRIEEILDELCAGKWPVMSPPPAKLAA